MATLTVRDLDEEVVRRLRIRAAEHGRSAEAEHREILRLALLADDRLSRHEAIAQAAEFRKSTAGRGSASVLELLRESRESRMRALSGRGEGA